MFNLSAQNAELEQQLLNPEAVYSRSDVLGKGCPVPAQPGVYIWFFKTIPQIVPANGCIQFNGLTALYVGISPGSVSSPQNLRKRVRTHFKGNAEGSTLRRTLGVLLEHDSGFPLRRVGSGKRMTFTHLGEQWLDSWLEENAFVNWIVHPEPWHVEHNILKQFNFPLNLQDNDHGSFAKELAGLRKTAFLKATEMPIANEGNQQRSSFKFDHSTTQPSALPNQEQLLQNLLKVQFPMAQEDPTMPSDGRETQQGSTMDYHQRMEELMEEQKDYW